MSGFFALFSALSAILLVTSLGTGLTGIALFGVSHLMWGLGSVLLAVSVHCLIFGIFTGAGKDARELSQDLKLDTDLSLRIKAFRKDVFPPALYSILLLVVGAVMGGAAHTPTMARVHMAIMIFTVAYNLKSFWTEYRAVAENGRLVRALNELASNAPAELSTAAPKELEILNSATEELDWGTHVFALGSFLVFMGMNVWLPYLYFRFVVGYFLLPLWPFLLGSGLLIGGGFYLRKRYGAFRPSLKQ